jgi:hypothetical protein
VNNQNAIIIADTGCTAMIISEDFANKYNLKTEKTEPQEFKFANKTRHIADRIITNHRREKCVQEYFVWPIKHDAILGTPWFNAIRVTQLEWQLQFTDLNTGLQ